jgi:hypothetical protein
LAADDMASSIRREVLRQIREEGTGNKLTVVLTANTQRGINHSGFNAVYQMLKGNSDGKFK